MSKQWKWTLAAALVLALAVAVPSAQSDVPESADPTGEWTQPAALAERNLLELRVDADALGRPMVTLDSDGPCEFESFVLDGPDRLVLDMPGVVSRLDQYRYPVGYGGVNRVRAAQHQMEPQPITRVVFDLEGPAAYRIDQAGSSVMVVFGDEAAEAVAARPTPVEPAEKPTVTADVVQEEVEPAPPVVAQAEPAPVATEPPPAEPQTAEPTVMAMAEPEPVEVADVPQEQAEPVKPIEEAQAQPASRSVEPDLIERLLDTPALAAPQAEEQPAAPPATFETQTIVTEETVFSGKRISLNLVDADIKQVFRLFHEISGLNFVLDPAVSGRVTVVLDQVPWTQALDLILKNNGLDKVYEGNVLRIATTQQLAAEAAGRKQLKEAKEMEVEPITMTRTLSYAKAEDVQRVIRESGILSTRGKVIVDPRTNTMIISDVPKKVEPLDVLISTLDSETPQVMIEARIVETSKDFSRDLGIVWGFEAKADASRGTATGVGFPHNASMKYALNLPGQGGASALAFSFGNVVDSFTLDLQLNALEDEGRGRILSSPKIATQNNERAEIEQGVRIPIVNTTATEINVEFVSASLLLNVTPQITAEGTIILDVVVENNSPDFNNTAGGIPSITTQRAQTKVLISDGGTTVIGGIFVVREGESEIGVPWFRKIPVFGWLFKNQRIIQENRELLIFITPKIIKLG
jgi:type IV pilus assembly protein PilQ